MFHFAMATAVLFLLEFFADASRSSLLIRKCCGETEHLLSGEGWGHARCSAKSDVTRLTVENMTSQHHRDFSWWINSEQEVVSMTPKAVSSFLEGQPPDAYIEFGGGMPCEVSKATVIFSTFATLLRNGTLSFNGFSSNIFFPPDEYCIDLVKVHNNYDYVYLFCPCIKHRCVQTCCPDPYEVLQNKKIHSCKHISDLRNDSSNLYISHSFEVVTARMFVTKYYDCEVDWDTDVHYTSDVITWNMFDMRTVMTRHGAEDFSVLHGDYVCANVGVDTSSGTRRFVYVRCRDLGNVNETLTYSSQVITTFLLLLVFILYLAVPELRNTKAKIIISHIISVFIYHLVVLLGKHFLVIREVFGTFENHFYEIFRISALLWVNVLCFDLAVTIRKNRSPNRTNRVCDRKFVAYSVYACGLAVTVHVGIYVIWIYHYEKMYVYLSTFIVFYPGVISTLLLSYCLVAIVVRQRDSNDLRGEDSARHIAASCYSRYRTLLVHVNLLLLMGPPGLLLRVLQPHYSPIGNWKWYFFLNNFVGLLRAITLLLFIFLKPGVPLLIARRLRALYARCRARCSTPARRPDGLEMAAIPHVTATPKHLGRTRAEPSPLQEEK